MSQETADSILEGAFKNYIWLSSAWKWIIIIYKVKNVARSKVRNLCYLASSKIT